MELRDTAPLMNSKDYKERFRAEYFQTKIRFDKLRKMVGAWDSGNLNFTPTCSRSIYDKQLAHMRKYLDILEERAKIEKVDLTWKESR